ncbi:MAG: hypothetical protein ABIG89_05220 [Candidatus Woesearchaeota archaeon]
MQKEILIAMYILLGIYIFYRLFLRKNKDDKDFEKFYEEVLNSKEYKVKGQYEK